MTKYLSLSLLAVFLTGFISCTSSEPEKPNVNVNISVADKAPTASEGFNLEQFHRLLIEEGESEAQWDAQFLSDLVNRPDINNLDLNGNGVVDTILIEPFDGGDSRGFQLYTKVMDYEGMDRDEEQTICTVVVEQEGDKGSLTVSGNEQMYGQQHHYHSSGMGSFFMMYWLMSPRFNSFGNNYNPSYDRRSPSSTAAYNDKMNNRNANHTGKKAPTAERPAAVKKAAVQQKTAAKGVKSKLANPTSSQRSFRAKTQTKSNAASGFGKKSTGTRSSSSSGRSGGRSSGGK